MEFKTYAPGQRVKTRKGKKYPNKKWIVRFRFEGQDYEIATDAANKSGAEKEALDFIRNLDDECGPVPGSVRDIIDIYKEGRRPSDRDAGYLDRIADHMGNEVAAHLEQADFDECCRALYPGRTNDTWNRQVFTPLIAALNWSGITMKLKRPKMKAIEDAAYECLTKEQRDLLIANAQSKEIEALLCLWCMDGLRVTESISLLAKDRRDEPYADIRGGRIKTIQRKGGKTRVHWRAMHPRTQKVMRKIRLKDGERFFEWTKRWQIDKYIDELEEITNIRFHPHMGRHTFADQMDANNASLRQLMDAGGWRSPAAAMRYTHSNVERQRALKKKL